MRYKEVPGFPGYYSTRKGNIFTFKMINKYKGKWEKVIPYKSSKKKNAYLTVWVYCQNGERHRRRVNRLVALAWIPNPLNLPIVEHIDHNKLNNYYKNLKWSNHQNNVKSSLKAGHYKNGYTTGTQIPSNDPLLVRQREQRRLRQLKIRKPIDYGIR